ncbi:MAG TPA: DUF2723 domain-containing protein [Kiritimatiellia bacterium]|nr:DUF2723 domain-containing protein [Kiritimatiellia bacterium]
MARNAVPGESATLIAIYEGLDPAKPSTSLIWGTTGRVLGHLFPGNLALGWNLLSLLSSVAACVLLYLITIHLVGTSRDKEILINRRTPYRNFAGLVAAGLLATSAALRHTGSMAHPLPFHMALLLLAIWCALNCASSGKSFWAAACLLVYGLVLSDYSPAILASPVIGGLIAYGLWKHQRLSIRLCLTFTGIFLIGLLPGLLLALGQQSSTTAPTLPELLTLIAREHAYRLRHAVPRQGWILVLIFTLIPLWILLVFRQTLTLATVIIWTVLAVIAFLLFSNSPISPWMMFGTQPVLLMPYSIGAAWAGCLAAYILALILTSPPGVREPSSKLRVRRTLGAIYLLLIVALIGVSGYRNHGQHPRSLASVSSITAAMIHHLPSDAADPVWILDDEPWTSLFRIHIADQPRYALTLSPSRISQPAMRTAWRHALANKRLGLLLEIGIVPALREQQSTASPQPPLLATFTEPVLIREAAGQLYPQHGLFVSRNLNAAPESLILVHQEFMTLATPLLDTRSNLPPWQAHIAATFLRLLSRVANETGVTLEATGFPDLAMALYEDATRLHPDNLSAHLNLQQLLDPRDPRFDALSNEIEHLSAPLRGRADIRTLTERFGTIRHPDLSPLLRTPDTHPDHPTLADHPLIQPFESADDDLVFQTIIAILPAFQPESTPSTVGRAATMLGVIRTPIAQGRTSLARRLLDTLPPDALPPEVFAIEYALLDLAENNRAQALARLTAIPPRDINDPRALALLALLTAEERPVESDRYLERLERFPELVPQFSLPLARLYLLRGKRDPARAHLGRILQNDPANIEALRLLVRARMDEPHDELLFNAIRQLLHLDTTDPIANEAWAAWLERTGRPDAAHAVRQGLTRSTDP